ncbi:MAG: IclR family transcriptional regulator [Pseudomonadota bacterium]
MAKHVQGTQSLSRSIGLLEHIGARSEPPRLQDLLAECEFTRPTLYRLLAGLEAEGLIVQTPDRRYLPGLRLVSLARRALARNDIRDLARAHLEKLRDQTGETVHLAIPSGSGLVYIDKIESHETVRMSSTIGTSVPFHSSGVGKAYLAALPDAECASLIKATKLEAVTPYTTTDPDVLAGQIANCQSQGFIFDDQENETGIVCFGAAILEENDSPAAAVSVSVPLFRLRDDRSSYSEPLLDCVKDISRQLGNAG